jgi:hypothetical protein
MMGIIVVTLYSRDDDETWIGTQILNTSSSLSAENQEMRSRLGAELQYWAETREQAKAKMTDCTVEKINKQISDVGEDIKNYSIYQDILDDEKLMSEN